MADGQETGIVVCAACGWHGVPTFLGGKPQNACPRCKKKVASVPSPSDD